MQIAVVNGPNLNFLGIREPEIYGTKTLDDLEKMLKLYVHDTKKIEINLTFYQSNSEGKLIDFLQKCYTDKVDGIVINPGALTHYSYALSDAIKSIMIPTIEVHISNISQREEYRQHSVTANACVGSITGLGFMGYQLAIDALYMSKKDK
ncbi:MAG: type II 3-dehydroquinate dehydratase [Cellulosilyticaceae bacterium]